MNLSLELYPGFNLVWPQSRIRTQGTASQRTANQVELQASSFRLIMKYTTVKISEILKHPTKRMDAKYWIKKKIKGPEKPSYKHQALT